MEDQWRRRRQPLVLVPVLPVLESSLPELSVPELEAHPGESGSWAQGPAVGNWSVAASALEVAPVLVLASVSVPVIGVRPEVVSHPGLLGSWAQGPAVGN